MGRDGGGGGSRANVRNEGVGRGDLLISSCAASAKRGAGEEKKEEDEEVVAVVVETKVEVTGQAEAKREGGRTQCPNPGSLEFLASGAPTYREMPEVCVLRRARRREERRRTTSSL